MSRQKDLCTGPWEGYEKIYKEKYREKCSVIEELAQYGINGVYKDAEIAVIAKGPLDFHEFHDFRAWIKGSKVFDVRKGILVQEEFDGSGNWIDIIKEKIKEKESGLSYDELRKLYIQDGVRLKELEDDYQKAERKLEESREKVKKYKNDYKDLLKQKEELEKQIEVMKTEQSGREKGFSYEAVVSFLYSNIIDKKDLEIRHKQLQKLLHPDNFRADSSLFQLVESYYERIKGRME